MVIRYLGSFSALTKRRGEQIPIGDDENVGSLLDRLVQKYGRKLKRSLSGEMTTFLLNGSAARRDATLHHGDELTIATLVGGG